MVRRLDAFFESRAGLDVLMLSGGQPTIHPQFAEILNRVLQYPIQRVLVNTNGLRMAQNGPVLAAIAERRQRVELYFSFASFRPETHVRLYGRDLRLQKLCAMDRVAESGILVTLVPTVERDVNDDELGELYQFALSRENVNGITFQPVMSSGRYRHAYRPEERLTLTDTLAKLEEQTSGALRSADFVGLPCSHPDCCALTYGFLDASRSTLYPLPRYLDVARYLELFEDRISFSGLLGASAQRIWSDMARLRGRQTLLDLARLFRAAGFREALPLIGNPDAFARRIFRVVAKPFMDAHTYDVSRIRECCTRILDENCQPVSFCEYNVLRRGRSDRIPLYPR